MQKITDLHKNLTSETFKLYVPIYMYFLYGGSLFTIEKKIFKSNFNKLINNLSYVLTQQQIIMTKNVNSNIKSNSFQNKVLNDSLNIVCCCMSK